MLMRESYIWNFIIFSLLDSHSVIMIYNFCMFLSMFLQRKRHQYLKKLKWKMSPCTIPQNMIRLIMVFNSPDVYFTAALWSCSSEKIPLFIFSRHSCIYYYPIFISTFNLFQFLDNKDICKIRRVGEINCPAVYPLQTVKIENEGKTIEVSCHSACLGFFCQN